MRVICTGGACGAAGNAGGGAEQSAAAAAGGNGAAEAADSPGVPAGRCARAGSGSGRSCGTVCHLLTCTSDLSDVVPF